MIWIFSDHPRESVGRNAGVDLRPGLSIVGGLIKKWTEVVKLVHRSGKVSRRRIERRSFNGIHLYPLRHAFRRDVFPVLAPILRHLDQAIVRTDPKQSFLERRFRYGEDHV